MQVKIYKISQEALTSVKKVLEAPEEFRETEPGKREFVTNKFARNGYVLRDGASLGLDADSSYLYVKGEDAFFAANEKHVLVEGVKKLETAELENAKAKIEAEQASAEAGVGAVFGEL